MDIMAEKRGPLKQNQKQKPAQMLGMVIHMEDTAMDIMAEKRGPLKRNQKQKPAQMLWPRIPWIWVWPRWLLRWILRPRIWLSIWWIRLWILWPKKRGPLKQNQKQKPAQMLGMDTEDMVDIMVDTTAEVMVIHMEDTAMDIMAEKKRSAEAEAEPEADASPDAWVGYGGYGYGYPYRY